MSISTTTNYKREIYLGMGINIGVDAGYGYIMSSAEIGEVKFSSYIKKVTEQQALEIKSEITKAGDVNKILVKYNDAYYALGRLCEDMFPNETRMITNDRVGNVYHLVQILTSIALTLKNSNSINANLMVGVPNRLAFSKKQMKQWLENKKYEISLIGTRSINKTISIDLCHCLLQPVFPVFSAFDEVEISQKSIMSLDIGHSSTDAIVMKNFAYSQEREDIVAIQGMNRVYNWIEGELINRFHKNHMLTSVPESKIQSLVENGVFYLNGKKVDVSDILSSAMDDYANFLFMEVNRKYLVTLPVIDVILVSGGVASNEDFMRTFAKLFKNMEIDVMTEAEPQWSVCRGMKNVMDQLIADDALETVNR